jgi:hypothetical protein
MFTIASVKGGAVHERTTAGGDNSLPRRRSRLAQESLIVKSFEEYSEDEPDSDECTDRARRGQYSGGAPEDSTWR